MLLLWKPNAKDQRGHRPPQDGSTDHIRWKVSVVDHTACCTKDRKEHWGVAQKRCHTVERQYISSSEKVFPLLVVAIAVAKPFAIGTTAETKILFQVEGQ